ncbi:MAG: hypothetical protein FWH27_04625 [Planctomycetaceae bacterium]|nr:hypothetical protein [Planctomycetaceae bacterium]
MSKRNSAQPITMTQKLLGKWATLCVQSPYPVLTLCVLFSLAGYIAAWILWFPYSSPVSQLLKNCNERLAWEETSRRTQFNSDIMIRVSIPDSGRLSQPLSDLPASKQPLNAEERLDAAVDLLKDKLSGGKKYFCDVISSRDMQPGSTRELYELPDDAFQTLYAELHDARQVLGGRWALLESASYVDWLIARLNQNRAEMTKITSQKDSEGVALPDHATPSTNIPVPLIQNRRLLVAAARFAEGLRSNLSQPGSQQNCKLITPWQLNPNNRFGQTDATSATGKAQPHRETTVILWARLAEPQLANLLDRRVIGKHKKIDHQLIGKLNASMTELFRIVEDARQEFDDIAIEPFGVPVDVHHGQTAPFPLRTAGALVMFAVLTLLFIAGLGHIRLYLGILIVTVCSFGTYLGFCALWFEMVTPYMLFIGISVPLFGICAGVLQAATYLNARHRGRSVSEAIIAMMQMSGKSTLSGGLISVIVFLAGVFYLWFYPVEPTTATLSFRSSLVGINLTLFLLVLSVLACLIGQLAVMPALMQVVESNHDVITAPWQRLLETRNDLAPHRTLPTIPFSVNVVLTLALFGGFLYFASRPNVINDCGEQYFVTVSEKQAAVMPILVSRECFLQAGWDDIPGLFACDASQLVADNDANRCVMIDNMSRIAGHTSMQQKIPLPDQRMLYNSLHELYQRLAEQFAELQKLVADGTSQTAWLQEDLRLCQTAGSQIAEACRLLSQIPQQEYGERIDAWQQAIASDLVAQQRSLQIRLRHADMPGTGTPLPLPKRFLGADQQPLVWLFPVENWQKVTSQEQPLSVIDLLTARISQLKTQPNHLLSARGGFPLLVLNGRQLMRQQLPVVGAVTLVALLLSIVVLNQSIAAGAMTVLTFTSGISLYGLILLTLGIPLGKITLFSIAFFPLTVPLFLDLFRQARGSPNHFKANLGGTLICFGVGMVITGHLMFSADAALVIAGRAMTIGWAALMLPLMISLISIPQPENAGQTPTFADQESDQFPDPPKPKQPASLAPRDQLDFYRERIEASHVFGSLLNDRDEQPLSHNDQPLYQSKRQDIQEKHTQDKQLLSRRSHYRLESDNLFGNNPSGDSPSAKPGALVSRENRGETVSSPEITDVSKAAKQIADRNTNPIVDPLPPPEVSVKPKFPPVWSVGTKRRATRILVLEHADEAAVNREKVVSLAPPAERGVARKSPKIVLAANLPKKSQLTYRENDMESPTILPMHRQGKTTEKTQTTSRRKLG